MNQQIAIVGATGYTGRLIIDELVNRGVSPLAVGRDPAKLAMLPESVNSRVADATDPQVVRQNIEGIRAVASCVPAFVDHGHIVANAAIATGSHYIDITSDPRFVRRLFEDCDQPARSAKVAIVPGVGFSFAFGDMAADLAARALGKQPDTVEVAYMIGRQKPSSGTKRAGLRTISEPCYVWVGGRLVPKRIGQGGRRFSFLPPDGIAHAALWSSGEVVTVPRHTGAANVTVLMRMSRIAGLAFSALSHAGPLLRLGQLVIGRGTDGPGEELRRRTHYLIVAEARAQTERTRVVIEGSDVYGLTAAACAEALLRTSDPSFDRAGAQAPAEAFPPEQFLPALDSYLSWRTER